MDDDVNWGAGAGQEQSQPHDCDPVVGWLSTEQLRAELFNAIMDDSLASCDEESDDFEEIDDYLDGDDEYESEAEQRRSTLRCLATLRPLLAELLGGPPAEQFDS